jgi:hypothetical protein
MNMWRTGRRCANTKQDLFRAGPHNDACAPRKLIDTHDGIVKEAR